MNLTALSIRRPSLIIVVFAVLTFMGVASYFNLPIEMVPKFDPPVITIMAAYPGASPAEVDGLAALSVPRPLLSVRATLSGTVIEAGVLAGDWVDLGANLFRLADLTTLWARLHIQEKDLSSVKAGAEAVLRTQAYPGEDFRGRLVLVGDVVDAGTRTVEGRVEVPNPQGRLKPGMYVDASVAAAGERASARSGRSSTRSSTAGHSDESLSGEWVDGALERRHSSGSSFDGHRPLSRPAHCWAVRGAVAGQQLRGIESNPFCA